MLLSVPRRCSDMLANTGFLLLFEFGITIFKARSCLGSNLFRGSGASRIVQKYNNHFGRHASDEGCSQGVQRKLHTALLKG